MSRGSDFVKALRPASFRGVPFGVTASRKVFGRRTAVHEYPFRDEVWVEDLGRRGRQITMAGFLVADSVAYGGGAVLDQQNRFIVAVETSGPGKLVHPTLGEMNVSCIECSINESAELGGVLELDLTFLEPGENVFATLDVSTTQQVTLAAGTAQQAVNGDLSTVASPLLSSGSINAATALSTVSAWGRTVQSLANDATKIFRLASRLEGDFGRFFNGRNIGALAQGLGILLGPTSTITQIAQSAANAQAAVSTAIVALQGVAANLGAGASNNSPADLAGAAAATIAALQATAADPADAIRLLSGLAVGAPPVAALQLALGQAINDNLRRAAVIALAQAGTTYQPSSYDDANAVRGVVTAALDAEIQVAGDQGDDASFASLRALRVAVVKDLIARGATLAPFVTVNTASPLPDVVLAHRLYRDASRAGELVAEADPVSPLFMPTSFQALAV